MSMEQGKEQMRTTQGKEQMRTAQGKEQISTEQNKETKSIRIRDMGVSPQTKREAVIDHALKKLKIPRGDVLSWQIRKESVDARRKDQVKLVYTLDVTLTGKSAKNLPVSGRGLKIEPAPAADEVYHAVKQGTDMLRARPVVVGFGPCGIFAALILAESGYKPLVLERGKPIDQRSEDVERFWARGELSPESNALFGEGGAGAFSDGKLTTQISDPRIAKVLETLVEAGAPGEIVFKQKPHIGTDRLREVVTAIRERIIALGGEIRFGCRLTGLEKDGNGRISAVLYEDAGNNRTERLETDVMLLAMGHSARDTLAMLFDMGAQMEQKPFSMGVRIEHSQEMIDAVQLGSCACEARLGAAEYKLSHRCQNGRGVYTFCMCPGGQVIASASEEGGLVTNGMSYHSRSGQNANSALLVDIRTEDFESAHPLAGVAFQRKWERAAFALGGGGYTAPAQRLGDFMGEPKSRVLGTSPQEKASLDGTSPQESAAPTYRPGVRWTRIEECLPDFVTAALREAVPALGKKLRGFDAPDAVLTAVESRSSSPVRLCRDEGMQNSIRGLYPAGEGAGYAGGITSAAVDGVKAAEKIIKDFAPPQ